MFSRMRVTMVKKRLATGDTCRKCSQAEELLLARGLWNRVDEVIWADEADPDSPGQRLARKFGVSSAPFFLVEDDDGAATVYESVLKLIRDRIGASEKPTQAPVAAIVSSSDIEAAAFEFAARHPTETLRWGLERWGASLGIAFSGAEDVVLVHMAAQTGLPFSVFCLDTGRLHPETYRFMDAVRKRYEIVIDVMSPDAVALQTFVTKKGLFSFYEDGHQECCAIRKVEPLRRKLSTLRAWVTGQRRDQSPATRSALPVIETDGTFSGREGSLIKINPLAAWTSTQTWDYLRQENIPFNSLHTRGFVSIGCEPCTRATLPGEHERAGRWWWEESTKRECGLHIRA
jgi:phosphoadenosine phosphosulfate reductase